MWCTLCCVISVLLFFGIILVDVLRIAWCDDKYMNPEWKAPHAWSNHKRSVGEASDGSKGECHQDNSGECSDLKTAYNKLVTFLFDRDSFGVS